MAVPWNIPAPDPVIRKAERSAAAPMVVHLSQHEGALASFAGEPIRAITVVKAGCEEEGVKQDCEGEDDVIEH